MAGKLGLRRGEYGILTLHRPSNVDDQDKLALIVEKLCRIAESAALVFPIHPRTRDRLQRFGLLTRLESNGNVEALEPLGYIEFMSLVLDCRFALTDSGGIQEETSYLGIPCLTLRDNTERPVTVTVGTNRLIQAESLDEEVLRVLETGRGERPVVPLWDGATAGRVAASLRRHGMGRG